MKESLIRRLFNNGFLILENKEDGEGPTTEQIASILQSFSSLGYALDVESLQKISKSSIKDVEKFYKKSYCLMREGSDIIARNKVIFYPDFPHLENVSDFEFVVNAIMHYLMATENDTAIYIDTTKHKKARNVQEVHDENKKVLKIIDMKKAKEILLEKINTLLESNLAINHNDYDFLKDAFSVFGDKIKPNDIPFKENIPIYIGCLCDYKKIDKDYWILFENLDIIKLIKTPTDLLRIYVFLSSPYYNYNDLSNQNVNFLSLNRRTRRAMISILDNMAKNNPNIYDDLAKHEVLFKNMFRYLHIGEYKKYANIWEVASNFRNDRYKTYYGKLDENILNQDSYIELLKQRPGEFVRRVDFMLRNKNFDCEKTLTVFEEVCKNVSSNNILFQLWAHFKNRDKYNYRIFCIKGIVNKYAQIEDTREKISDENIKKVLTIIEKCLILRYSKQEKFDKKVYLDESLKKYMIPISERNTSTIATGGVGKIVSGSRIKLDSENYKFLRLFTHWRNIKDKDKEQERVDIDLSVEFIDENMTEIQSVSWHNMGGGRKIDTFHSGDLVTAPWPNGANEFLDIDFIKARKYYKYAIISNCVYTGQPFSEINDCYSGVMFMPEMAKKGKLFNPELVELKFYLKQKDVIQSIPFIIDLENLELIWVDVALNSRIASKNLAIISVLKTSLMERMSIYDLFKLHSGHIDFTENREDAEFVISDEEGADLTPFDNENIIKYL